MLSIQPKWSLISPAEACRVIYTRRTGWQCNFTTLYVVLSATLPISISTISGALTFEVSISLSVCRYNERLGLEFISSGNRAGIKYLTLRFLTNFVQGSFCLINVVSIQPANFEEMLNTAAPEQRKGTMAKEPGLSSHLAEMSQWETVG